MPLRPFCIGCNCPLKVNCVHYREVFDKKKEEHFTHTPYNHVKKNCAFFVAIDPEGLLQAVKNLKI